MYRIVAYTAGQTTLTLNSAFTGTTNTTAAYRIFQLEYDLASDVLRLIAPMRVYRNARLTDDYRVDGVALEELEAEWPVALAEAGSPELFAMVSETKIRFNRFGGLTSADLIRLEYELLPPRSPHRRRGRARPTPPI